MPIPDPDAIELSNWDKWLARCWVCRWHGVYETRKEQQEAWEGHRKQTGHDVGFLRGPWKAALDAIAATVPHLSKMTTVNDWVSEATCKPDCPRCALDKLRGV